MFRFALAALFLGPASTLAATVTDTGQGAVSLPADAPTAVELSGLTYAGGDQFYSVSDGGGLLFPIEIAVDDASGSVTGVSVGAALALAGGVDLEGVAYDGRSGTVLACDETGPAIREHSLSDGAEVGSIAVPAIYSGARANLSLESLTQGGTGGALWTANEEALVADGAISSFALGTVVRLQRFDAAGAPAGQWAYEADPIPGGPIGGLERSGVVELLALPSDELLVLERSFSSQAFRNRIYQVDLDGATDTSALTGLAVDPFTPVGKTLLFELVGLANFEGMALGPLLDAGDRSLLLVSDNGGSGLESLRPLRVQFVPEPGGCGLLLVGGAVFAARTRVTLIGRSASTPPFTGA